MERAMRTPPKSRAKQKAARRVIVLALDCAVFESALAKASKAPPEIIDRLLCALDAGEEIARLDVDDRSASAAGKLTVRLNPSGGLARLVSAL